MWQMQRTDAHLLGAPWYPPTSSRQLGVEGRNWRTCQCRMTLFILHFPLRISPRVFNYLDPSLSQRGWIYWTAGKHHCVWGHIWGQSLRCKFWHMQITYTSSRVPKPDYFTLPHTGKHFFWDCVTLLRLCFPFNNQQVLSVATPVMKSDILPSSRCSTYTSYWGRDRDLVQTISLVSSC